MATAELAPFVKVGGLADAVAGLAKHLRGLGVEVEVVLPDYGDISLSNVSSRRLDTPRWTGPATVQSGSLPGFQKVSLVETPHSQSPHPYSRPDGSPLPDLGDRLLAFSTAVAQLAADTGPDIVHINDWHTAAVAGLIGPSIPTVLTIHNLAYQGASDRHPTEIATVLGSAYELRGEFNPLAGAIRVSSRVVTVSPTFAKETLTEESGFGLNALLEERGEDFCGILNGIDTETWDPAIDPALPVNYDTESLGQKFGVKRKLCEELEWDPSGGPLIGMVTRLTDQKGVDLALGFVPRLEDHGARMILLGSGDSALAEQATSLMVEHPGHFSFFDGYDEGLSHRIFGGSDLFLMPSRFEPCGLAQMQAMRYGAIPVVTDVGGLHDTVVDADAFPEDGTGFVAEEPDEEAVASAIARADRAHRSDRGDEIRVRGMLRDWSWTQPAAQYLSIYQALSGAR